mgnify:CR=1 FL=1
MELKIYSKLKELIVPYFISIINSDFDPPTLFKNPPTNPPTKF